MTAIWQDMRYAARSLRRSRGFTATAVAVLSISIGLAAAVFTFVDAVLLRPLPYPSSDALVMLLDIQGGGPPSDVVAPGSLRDWRGGVAALEQIAAFNLAPARLETLSGPRRLRRVNSGLPRMVLVFWGASALLLAIVCANLTNLTMARHLAGAREIALRAALGAARWRLAALMVGDTPRRGGDARSKFVLRLAPTHAPSSE